MRFRQDNQLFFQSLPKFPLASADFEILPNSLAFKPRLLALIQAAKHRIYLSMLYLENDAAGQEILHALYQAKQSNPALEIKIFVDFHRAQRGLIGADKDAGNAQFYHQCQQQYHHHIGIYGVPVKSREVLGVLHLKGFIFDDTVLFSGASINDIYLQQQDRYRYDRYHVIHHQPLADSMVKFLKQAFVHSDAVQDLTSGAIPPIKQLKKEVLQLKRHLVFAHYKFDNAQELTQNDVAITPLAGLGARHNMLNKTIRFMIRTSQQKLVMFTPYFNLPPVLNREVRKLLKKGRTVTIVIGDKTANDFFIPQDQPFTKIGGLPYVYETNLRRFVQTNQKFINAGLLNIHLWSHENNSFHLKGINSDDKLHLLTGSNLNPRAWRLDLENGLLIQDPQKQLKQCFTDEFNRIVTHTKRIAHFKEIESLNDYPQVVRKLLRTIKRTKMDSVIRNII